MPSVKQRTAGMYLIFHRYECSIELLAKVMPNEVKSKRFIFRRLHSWAAGGGPGNRSTATSDSSLGRESTTMRFPASKAATTPRFASTTKMNRSPTPYCGCSPNAAEIRAWMMKAILSERRSR